MTDTQRELFEKAMRERIKDRAPSFKRHGKPAQNQYIVPDVQAAWVGYQAAVAHSQKDENTHGSLLVALEALAWADGHLNSDLLKRAISSVQKAITNRKDE